MLVFLGFQVIGQNNFEPCSDVYSESIWFSESQLKKGKQLMEFKNDEFTYSSILINPSLSFCSQYLALTKNSKTYNFKLTLKDLCFRKNKYEVIETSRSLTKDEAKAIIDLFVVALFHLEYNPKTMEYADGTSYHLRSEFWGVSHNLCGYVHSPIQAGNVRRFIDLSNDIIQFVKSDESALDSKLIERIKDLTIEMNVKKLNLADPAIEVQMFGEKFEFFLK